MLFSPHPKPENREVDSRDGRCESRHGATCSSRWSSCPDTELQVPMPVYFLPGPVDTVTISTPEPHLPHPGTRLFFSPKPLSLQIFPISDIIAVSHQFLPSSYLLPVAPVVSKRPLSCKIDPVPFGKRLSWWPDCLWWSSNHPLHPAIFRIPYPSHLYLHHPPFST